MPATKAKAKAKAKAAGDKNLLKLHVGKKVIEVKRGIGMVWYMENGREHACRLSRSSRGIYFTYKGKRVYLPKDE